MRWTRKNDATTHATGWVDFGSFHRLSEETRHSGSWLHVSPLHESPGWDKDMKMTEAHCSVPVGASVGVTNVP